MTPLGRDSLGNVITLADRDRRRHLYLVGQTGSGKTTTFLNLIRHDLNSGAGLAFFDPHGDASTTILDYVPKHRLRDVIYLVPSDLARPIGYNVLEGVPNDARATAADSVVAAFKSVWHDSWGPRLEHFLLNGVRTLMDYPGGTLLGLPSLFTNKTFRRKAVQSITDPVVRRFWEEEFASYSDKFLAEALSPILNKVGRVLSSPAIRNIVSQPSTINLRSIMDEGRILIVNLDKGALGEGNAHLLGALLVTGIAHAALSRSDTSPANRKVFHLYVDEFQSFATESFGLILSEARKYALTLTLGHQYLAQVPESLRQAVFGNVGSAIIFRVGAEDAPLLGRHLGLENPERLQDLPNFQAMVRLLSDGTPGTSRTVYMQPLPPPEAPYGASIITRSRNRYGRYRATVEERINRFLAAS